MADAHHPHSHSDSTVHHHHGHAALSRHPGGHHLLQVEDLSVAFRMYDPDAPFFKARRRWNEVISHLSLGVHGGEIVALVGASGSGKSILADSVMGLFEPNALVTGRVWYDGEPLDARRLAALRGTEIVYVPQSVASLDPLMRVGRQITGPDRSPERLERMERLLSRYGLAPEVARLYPHELSGGMARRVLLACALMEKPRLLLADEPTPGLDEALALRALADFRAFADTGGAVVLITHDIELALKVADRIAVFHSGTVIEETAAANFASPDLLGHPFTRALWYALPEHGFTTPLATATAAPAQSNTEGGSHASR